MKGFVSALAGFAILTSLAGCTNFKATDKLMSNEHRIIQNTRIVQRVATQEVKPAAPFVQRAVVQPPVTQPIIRRVIQTVPTQQIVRTVVSPQEYELNELQFLTRIQVIEMQRALRTRGLYSAPIDGIFGVKTANGLLAYQTMQGESGPISLGLLKSLGLVI